MTRAELLSLPPGIEWVSEPDSFAVHLWWNGTILYLRTSADDPWNIGYDRRDQYSRFDTQWLERMRPPAPSPPREYSRRDALMLVRYLEQMP